MILYNNVLILEVKRFFKNEKCNIFLKILDYFNYIFYKVLKVIYEIILLFYLWFDKVKRVFFFFKGKDY